MSMRKKIASFLPVLTVLTVGCVVGPDYERPCAILSDSFTQISAEEGVHQQIGADLADWWTNINDPILTELIHQTVGSGTEVGGSLSLQEMAWRIQQTRARLGITRSELFPQLQADGSYDLRRYSENQVGAAAGDAVEKWNLGTSMSWEVDVFGRLRRYTESAVANVEGQEELYRDAYIILLSDVATNYVQARALQQQIEIAKKNIATRKETLKLTEVILEIGKGNKLDVSQARGSLESVESDLPLLEASYRTVLNRLSVLTGNPPGYVDDVMATPAPIPEAPSEIMVGIPAELLRRRPDIRAAEKALVAQNALIGAAVGDLYPIFSLNGNFGLDAAQFNELWKSDNITAGITPAFRWNIFNFGRYRSNVRLQEYMFQEEVAAYRQTVLLAAEEVDNALASYSNERVRVEKLHSAMESYDKALQLSEERYQEGAADFQRVLDSQREKLIFELAYVKSKADITTDVINLYRALGGGWMQQPQTSHVAQNDAPVISDGENSLTTDGDDGRTTRSATLESN